MLYFILLEYIFFILEDSCTSIRAYSRLYYIDIIFVQDFIFKKLLYSIHVFFFCSCNFASSPTTPNKNQPTSGASASQRSGRGTLRYLRALLGWRSPRSQQKHRKKWGRYGVMSFFVDLMFFLCSWFSWEKYRKHDFESEELNFVGTSCISSQKMN